MTKIKFKIYRDTLTASILKKDLPKENLNNTNVIDTKEIVFSSVYIIENFDLVLSFLNLLIIKQNVSKVIVRDFNIAKLILKIITEIPSINDFTIKENKIINYDLFILFIESKYLKKIDVYEIPKVLLERLDFNKNLKINVRSELFFISDFMKDNNLNTYSDIYYKKSIVINKKFNSYDEDDFNTFINISYYLKSIVIKSFDKQTLEYISHILQNNDIKNIKIIIYEKGNNLNLVYKSVADIKKTYDSFFRKNKIVFKVSYTPEYKRNNFFKQLNINFLKGSLVFIVILISTLFIVNKYKNYIQLRDIQRIEDNLNDVIEQIDDEYPFEEEITSSTEETTTRSSYVSSYYKNYDKVFDTLLKINDDTKGWITVNNTRIDYPVVQGDTNDYYLNRDFNEYKNSMGWIFMDFRNDIGLLNQNTIIYGHNITAGIMFGTLKNALTSRWLENPENHVITFNTLNESMTWQIISVYTIPETTDYLKTTFYEKDEYKSFLDLIVGRSIYNFNQTYDYTDKILTLSTCYSRGNDRVVVHAKLIK